MSPLATTPCPHCGNPVAFDPALAADAACPHCGERVAVPPPAPVTFAVNGRPVDLTGFRPSPMVVVAVAVAAVAMLALAAVVAAIAVGVAVLVVAPLLVAAGWARVWRAFAAGGGPFAPWRRRLPPP